MRLDWVDVERYVKGIEFLLAIQRAITRYQAARLGIRLYRWYDLGCHKVRGHTTISQAPLI